MVEKRLPTFPDTATDRKGWDGNIGPWKPNARLKQFFKTSRGENGVDRFLISITGNSSIACVISIGHLV